MPRKLLLTFAAVLLSLCICSPVLAGGGGAKNFRFVNKSKYSAKLMAVDNGAEYNLCGANPNGSCSTESERSYESAIVKYWKKGNGDFLILARACELDLPSGKKEYILTFYNDLKCSLSTKK